MFNLNEIEDKALPKMNFKSTSTLGEVIAKILPYIFTIAGILLLFYLVIGGFQLMTSAGDPKGVESAKNKITSALIGFFIIFLSYFIVRLIGQIFGIQAVLNIFSS